jgi:hypothetical protein
MAGNPPVPPASPGDSTDPSQSVIDNLNAAISAAPELGGSPGAAVDVASNGGNIPNAAVGVAATGNHVSLATAATSADKTGDGNWLTNTLGSLGHAVKQGASDFIGDVGKIGNMPMSYMQHAYRYLHDVEATHGLGYALGEGLAIAGAFAAGTLLTGGVGDVAIAGALAEAGADAGAAGAAAEGAEGADTALTGVRAARAGYQAFKNRLAPGMLGAAGAATVEGQVMFRDSWNRTTNPNYRDPHTGQLVSFGRDIADGLRGLGVPGFENRSGAYNAISGLSDALYDIWTDPLGNAGSVVGQAHSLEGVGGVLGRMGYTGRGMTSDTLAAAANWANPNKNTANLERFINETILANKGNGAAILSRAPRLADLVFGKYVTDATPATESELWGFRTGSPGEVHAISRAESETGSYYSFGRHGVDPDAYATKGGPTTQVILNTANTLHVTEGVDAHSAAILKLLGPQEWDRLSRLDASPAGRQQIANEMFEKFGVDYQGSLTKSPLQQYAVALARKRGFKSISFLPTGERAAGAAAHAGPQFLALSRDAIRESGATRYVKGLEDAEDKDDAVDIFRQALARGEVFGSELPALTHLGAKWQDIRKAMQNADFNGLHPVTGHYKGYGKMLGTIGKLTTRIPGTTYNRATRAFEVGSWNPVTMHGAHDLILELQYGLGRDYAERVVTAMAHADVPTRIQMYRNVMLQNVAAHAGIDLGDGIEALKSEDFRNEINEPGFRKFLQRLYDQKLPDYHPDASGVYGATPEGSMRPRVGLNGVHQAVAILEHQTGDIQLHGFNDVHRWGQMLHDIGKGASGMRAFTGTLDDWTYDALTNPIKKALLTSVGYAMHIATAEMVQNLLRVGVFETARSSLYTAAARMGYKTEFMDELLPDVDKISSAELDARKDAHIVNGKFYSKGLARTANRVSMWKRQAEQQYVLRMHHLFEKLPLNPRELQYAAAYVIACPQGLDALRSGERLVDSNDDPVGVKQHGFANLRDAKVRRSSTYTEYGPDKPTQQIPELQIWHRTIGKSAMSHDGMLAMRRVYNAGGTREEAMAAARLAVRAHIDNMDPIVRSGFSASQLLRDGDPPSMHPYDAWADDVVNNFTAATHSSKTGEANSYLLDQAIKNRPVSLKRLSQIPIDERPLKVPGRELVPNADNWFNRATSTNFRRVLNPIVDHLSRNPLTAAEYMRRMRLYEPMLARNELTMDQAVNMAIDNAAIDTIRYIHNVHDRTQMDQLVRNFGPFFFAQEQAYRRMGRLLINNPGAFRRFQIMISGVHKIVSSANDGAGSRYFTLPGAGYLGTGVVDGFAALGVPMLGVNPAGFGGTLTSAQVIFPFSNGIRPDLSPLVVIGAKALAATSAALGNTYSPIHGATDVVQGQLNWGVGEENMNSSMLDNFVPNTLVSRAIESAQGDDTAFVNAMFQTMQNLDYQQKIQTAAWVKGGMKGPEPHVFPPQDATPQQLQQFVSRVRNQTQVLFLMRAIIGYVSPISAEVTVSDFGLRDDLQAAIKQYGVAEGFTHFLEQHPDATAYTATESTVAGTNSSMPETAQAMAWVEQNRDFVNNNQAAAAYFIPQSKNDAYNAEAYNEQVADNLRIRDTPQQFLNNIYAAAGNAIYFKSLAVHDAALQAAGSDKSQEYNSWAAYMQTLQKTHPIWWQQFNDGTRQAQAVNAINQFGAMFGTNPTVTPPAGVQTELLRELYQNFEIAQQDYSNAGTSPNYQSEQKAITTNWQLWLDNMEKAVPQLTPVIQGVYHDALTYYNQT